MPVNTSTVTGIGATVGVTTLSVASVLGWLAQHYQLAPLPDEAALNGAAVLVIFFGGGLVWLIRTLVIWLLRERGIIKEQQEVKNV